MTENEIAAKDEIVEPKLANEFAPIVNGLEGVIRGTQMGGSGFGTQVSQTDTLFNNTRNYLISNDRQLLSTIYVEIGLVQNVIDIPVDDGLRGGVEIKSKQLSEEEIQDLQTSLEQDDDINTVGQALKWKRLFGGAGVLTITDQDPSTPLDIDAINENSLLEFRDVDMWEMFYSRVNTEEHAAALDGSRLGEVEFYDYYGKKVHHSRIMRMKGRKAPSFIRPRLRGWGYSEVEALIRSINQYLKANSLGFEVLDEFKLDIFKFKGLASTLMSPTGEEKVRNRVGLMNQMKSFQNALIMDAEDEYEQKQLSFAGLAEAMEGIRIQVASDMRMPLTKLFGVPAAGFNSGEDDIEVYNSMVESSIRTPAKADLLRVIKIKCKKRHGYIPDDLSLTFKPLRVLSAEQEENVKTQKFNRVLAAKTAGELTTLEFRNACNKDNLLSVQLDTTNAVLDELSEGQADKNPDDEENQEENPGKGKSPKGKMDAKEAKEPK